jgi:hypothetical protein
MDARHLESAAEFCSIVGAPHLLAYLGIDASCDPEEAASKLRERRKFMQGMQANPKYKQEAAYLIRNMHALSEVLREPAAYAAHVARMEEAAQLPVLEITIRGMLKGGSLTDEQEDYLRRNAEQMGISAGAFAETLTRIAAEVGAPLRVPPTPGPRLQSLPPVPSTPPSSRPPIVRPATSPQRPPPPPVSRPSSPRTPTSAPAEPHRQRSLSPAEPVKSTVQPFEVLHPTSERGNLTGPPARHRDVGPTDAVMGAPTAPPVRMRHAEPLPGRSSETDPFVRARNRQIRNRTRVEVVGDTVRRVPLKNKKVATRFTVQVTGGGGARVSTDQPWLLAEPQRVEPGVSEAVIEVRIDPQGFVGTRATGVVAVQTQDGDRANVAFEVERVSSLSPFMVAGAIGLVAIVAVAALGSSLLPVWNQSRSASLTIDIDPTAEEVRIDGVLVGSGPHVRIENPQTGIVVLSVTQSRFRPYETQFEVPPGRDSNIKIALDLATKLDFVPAPTMARASLDTAVVRRVMQHSTKEFDGCIRLGIPFGQTANGSLKIHIGKDGVPIGLEADASANGPAVRKCLERQVALLEFPALTDGDYATVRYDYNLSRETDR